MEAAAAARVRIEVGSAQKTGAKLQMQVVPMESSTMASTMRLIPTHSGTRLEYRADLTPDGGYLPQMLGPAAIRHETAEQFSALLREIQRR